MQHSLNGKLQLGDYFNARARSKIRRYRRGYVVKNIAFTPAILSVAGKIHHECLRLLWVMADMQTVKYFNLVGDENDIGSERFKWSRASTFNYNRNAIGLAVAYASAIRTHLSVHGAAHPMSAAAVRPRSVADCLIRSAVDISHPRQQGNPRACSSVASDPVRGDIWPWCRCSRTREGVAILRCSQAGLLALFPALLSLLLFLCHRVVVSTQPSDTKPSRSASSSLLARRPSSCFDVDNEEADARANVVVANGHADVRASAAIINDNDDDADDGDFDDTPGGIPGA